MRFALAFGAAMALSPVAALAGDAEAGATVFQRQCANCHVVRNEAGEVLAGRNAQQGPNLYGVVGRQAGIYPDFRYGASIVEAGAAGLVWDEASFSAYIENPNTFLRTFLNNNRARGNMAFQLRDAGQRADLYAFLATFSPAADEEEAAAEAEAEEAPAEGEAEEAPAAD
jgi:cytochrome c